MTLPRKRLLYAPSETRAGPDVLLLHVLLKVTFISSDQTSGAVN